MKKTLIIRWSFFIRVKANLLRRAAKKKGENNDAKPKFETDSKQPPQPFPPLQPKQLPQQQQQHQHHQQQQQW